MSSVHAAVAARFCAPEWATFFEVGNDAGIARSRSADAVAMNLWPSRGLSVHGIEIKVSRSDWLRELKAPAKAEPIQRFCDRWWIAVDDEAHVREGELPPTWGLMALRKGKLVTVREAPALTAVPLERGFIAALLRRATENVTPTSLVNETVETRVREQVERDLDSHTRNTSWKLEQLTRAFESQRDIVDAFERASGVKIGEYPATPAAAAKIGDAVRFVKGGGLATERKNLDFARRQIADLLERLDAAIAATPGVGDDSRRSA